MKLQILFATEAWRHGKMQSSFRAVSVIEFPCFRASVANKVTP